VGEERVAVAAHGAFTLDALRSVLVTVAAFSLCASSVYVLNDL
jgi:4-hydroxybenzoate polyprenyltransferase